MSMNQVLDYLKEELGTLQIEKQERKKGDARHTSADTSLIQKELGFSPKVSVREGIQKEIQWLRALLHGS